MNVIVTGGAGFIGNYLVDYLIKKQHLVTVIDNLHTGKINNKINFQKIDILEYKKLREITKEADWVFHLAALVNPLESFEKQNEYQKVNVTGTENIFRLAKEFGFKVVFASSAAVYGDSAKIPIREEFPKRPLNPYGKTKLQVEKMAKTYTDSGVQIIGLRYFNVYGKVNSDSNIDVISKFMKQISRGEPLIIYGDGTQTRDFVHVKDIVRANLLAMESKITNGFFNIGSGESVSILRLAREIISIAKISVKPILMEPLNPEIKNSEANIELAEKCFNWKPKEKLFDWIRESVK